MSHSYNASYVLAFPQLTVVLRCNLIDLEVEGTVLPGIEVIADEQSNEIL